MRDALLHDSIAHVEDLEQLHNANSLMPDLRISRNLSISSRTGIKTVMNTVQVIMDQSHDGA